MRPLVIGLTGSVGSGKTTCRKHAAAMGAEVVDADLLGHQAYKAGSPGLAKLSETFGDEILTADKSEVDRRKLGMLVFKDREALKRLTDVIWPEIRRLATERIDGAGGPDKIVLMEAAVLVEAEWLDMVDAVILTSLPSAVAISRLMETRHMSEEDARSRLDNQLSNEERKEKIEEAGKPLRMVDTSGTQGDTFDRMREALLALAAALRPEAEKQLKASQPAT